MDTGEANQIQFRATLSPCAEGTLKLEGEIMKNVLKIAGFAVAFGGIVIAVPNAALAGAHRFSGNICNPDGSSADSMTYGVYGVWNSSTTPNTEKAVTCGINLSNAPLVTYVKIVVYDRDGADGYVYGAANNVSCKVTLLDQNGSPVIAETPVQPPPPPAPQYPSTTWDAWGGDTLTARWGPSTSGGYWSPWYLWYDPPGTSVQAHSIVVRCLIPEFQGGDAASHVTAIEVNTSN